VRGEEFGDGRAESAEREDRLQGAIRGILDGRRRGGGDERVRLQRSLALHFLEIRGRGEAGVAHGFKPLNLVTERADELAVDVKRAAAHAGDRAHLLHAGIGELTHDERLAGAERIPQHAGDFDGKRLRIRAPKNGPHFALHPRLQIVQGQDRGVGRLGEGKAGEGGEED
jgi:hypothetical protein